MVRGVRAKIASRTSWLWSTISNIDGDGACIVAPFGDMLLVVFDITGATSLSALRFSRLLMRPSRIAMLLKGYVKFFFLILTLVECYYI
jgi:hypothetical protein